MKIKLVDGTTYDINDIKLENGTLYIEFAGKSGEEVRQIISQHDNLVKIILLEDNTGADLVYYSNFTVCAGVMLSADSKATGMLNQEKDDTLLRINELELKAANALTIAESAQNSLSTLSADVGEVKQASAQSANSLMLSFATAQIIAQDFEDEEAIKLKDIYPEYIDCIGKTVKKGFKMNHESVLYKVIQDELVIQEQYVPGAVGTESLYSVID